MIEMYIYYKIAIKIICTVLALILLSVFILTKLGIFITKLILKRKKGKRKLVKQFVINVEENLQ